MEAKLNAVKYAFCIEENKNEQDVKIIINSGLYLLYKVSCFVYYIDGNFSIAFLWHHESCFFFGTLTPILEFFVGNVLLLYAFS